MKRIIAIILAVGSLLMAGTANVVWAKDSNHSDKIICQATLEDDFADDCVLVVIDKENSKVNQFFAKEKFKGVRSFK